MNLKSSDPLSGTLTQVIRVGDLPSLERILATNPEVAAARIKDDRGSKTVLHVVTDWPGFFPNGPAIVKVLISAGAQTDAATEGGRFSETPLHWAASSDDVEVTEALIDGGANLEVRGGSIAGGTALENAIGYSWREDSIPTITSLPVPSSTTPPPALGRRPAA
jgi:uncharacterized protein